MDQLGGHENLKKKIFLIFSTMRKSNLFSAILVNFKLETPLATVGSLWPNITMNGYRMFPLHYLIQLLINKQILSSFIHSVTSAKDCNIVIFLIM